MREPVDAPRLRMFMEALGRAGRLHINIELAAPSDSIPELPGWPERSPFIVQHGPLAFHHYDLYSQVLAKLERAHALDLVIDPRAFRRRVEQAAR